jgi:rubrerythrin
MKKLVTIFIITMQIGAWAQKRIQVPKAQKSRPVVNKQAATLNSTATKTMSEALAYVRNGQCDKAAPLLFSMSRKNEFANERAQIKYILGQCLLELKLNQVAAFQFVDIIKSKNPKYSKLAIEKLSIAADNLGDDTLLNYAISKVNVDDFPNQNRDIIYFRLGEIKMKNAQFAQAQQLFAKVSSGSRYYHQAKYLRGLAFLEANQTDNALRIFQDLKELRADASVVDVNKVVTQMAIARTLYQAQKWEESMEAYRQIPRDSEYWHDALFESSWAMMRAAKFRSSLSNFQSLHSAYYEEFYLPESLLLRSIVYLYICKYDEMDKVLSLFEKSYGSLRGNLGQFMNLNRADALAYYNEIEKIYLHKKEKFKLPQNVINKIAKEGDVKRAMGYLKNLIAEKNRLDALASINRTNLGSYASKLISNRAKNAKIGIGEMVRNHVIAIRSDLKDFYEQVGFIRYEMINGEKEILKKKIAGKVIEKVDEKLDREFYVQNGYEYWPFDGEYWLDEIGNYQFLGKQSCE